MPGRKSPPNSEAPALTEDPTRLVLPSPSVPEEDADRATEADMTAWLGTCDGQGAFPVLVTRKVSPRRFVACNVVIRVTGGLRDGFSWTGLSQRDIDDLFEQVETMAGIDLVEIPLSLALALARQGLERTERLQERIPEGAASGLHMLLSMGPAGEQEPLHSEPGPIDRQRVQAALDEFTLGASWFIDALELREANAPAPPTDGEDRGPWRKEAARALGSTTFKPRLEAMCRHMALWFEYAGEEEHASVMLGCAEALAGDADLSQHPLVLEMLDIGADQVDEKGGSLALGQIGDVDRRERLRKRFFKSDALPRGRDLAHLNYGEAAASALDTLVLELPAEQRPDSEALEGAAFRAGQGFADAVIDAFARSRPLDPVTESRKVRAALEPAFPAASEALDGLARGLAEALAAYLFSVCEECPVRCLSRPDEEMDEPFYSALHPAFVGPPHLL